MEYVFLRDVFDETPPTESLSSRGMNSQETVDQSESHTVKKDL